MKLTIFFSCIVIAALVFAGCQDESGVQPPVAEDPDVAAFRMIDEELVQCHDDSLHHRHRKFDAKLSGRNEVPPTDSKAKGHAKFELSKDGTEIKFELTVGKIKNVVGAHVHRGGVGVNGPVVIALFGDTAGGGKAHGKIAKGTFTPADLVGPYAGSTDFSMFLADLHADSLYVNVHTDDGIDSTSGHAGDYPGGEIRGQLHDHKEKGHKHDDHGKGHGKDHDKDKGHGKDHGKGHDHDGDDDDQGENNDHGHGRHGG